MKKVTKLSTLVIISILSLNVYASKPEELKVMPEKKQDVKVEEKKIQAIQPFYQGKVVEVKNAGSYSYLEIKEHSNKTFWIAVSRAEIKVGDYVRFQKELVTTNYKSKSLNKTFRELMFASNLQHRVTKETN